MRSLLLAVRLAVAVSVLLVGLPAADLLAQSTDAVVTKKRRGLGLLSVSTELVASSANTTGIARVTVKNAKGPTKADRNLTVVLYIKPYGRRNGVSYSAPVTLAEGAMQTSIEFPYIEYEMQTYWDVGVFEGRVDIEDKSQLPANGMTFRWGDTSSISLFAALRASSELESDVREDLEILHPDVEVVGTVTTTGTTTANASRKIVPLDQAGENWQFYFPFDSWALSIKALRELQQAFPAKAKALRDYTAAGGKLIIHGASTQTALEDIERFLNPNGSQPDPTTFSNWQTHKSPTQQWWLYDPNNLPKPKNKSSDEDQLPHETTLPGLGYDASVLGETWLGFEVGVHLENMASVTASLGFVDQTDDVLNFVRDLRYDIFSAASTDKILHRPFLAGSILVCPQSADHVNPSLMRTAAKNTLLQPSMANESADGNWFWKNLITAVGRPPVWSFAVMVSLFSTLLGPGLLFFTGRVGRRSLMILLVPVIALSATIAIIVYSVVREGFGAHARVVSISFMEEGNPLGFAWSRQNLFSGLPPREGISFSGETYARNVDAEDTTNYGYPDPRDNVSCSVYLSPETGDRVWRGWLRPRQQQQILLGHPVESPSLPIRVQRVQREAAGIRIENISGHTLPFVALRGDGDAYFFTDALEAGEVRSLEPLTREEVGADVARLMADRKPAPPPEMEDGGSLLNFGSRRGAKSSRYNQSSDVFMTAMNRFFSDRLQFPVRTLATILPHNPDVIVPIDCEQSAGLHMVIGEFQW